MRFRTRFAPSPTGPLHLGHAYSAVTGHNLAVARRGDWMLRIEDTDHGRCRPAWEDQIYQDLTWLGLIWTPPVLRQSERRAAYDRALETLAKMGLTYPCSCTRRDIQNAASAPQEGAPQAPSYPGTCRGRPLSARQPGDAVRLNMASALKHVTSVAFQETGPLSPGQQTLNHQTVLKAHGDVVLARRDESIAYHLAVVVDDAAQNISHVVRGHDLYDATSVHVLLQRLLGLPTPVYHHHGLVRDERGTRLAKRDASKSIATYRQDGLSPADVYDLIGLQPVTGSDKIRSSPPATDV